MNRYQSYGPSCVVQCVPQADLNMTLAVLQASTVQTFEIGGIWV